MFMELGRRLDNFLVDVRRWNTQRIWYKIYGHFFISQMIRKRGFDDREHFDYFMDIVLKNKQIFRWQYDSFVVKFNKIYGASIKEG
jgi:hypothetical protein